MNICVDENIPLDTVSELRVLGHDVLDIRGSENEGIPDDVLWQMTQNQNRLLITTDKGFTQYRNETHAGILIIRLKQPNALKIHDRAMKAICQFSHDEWPGQIVVMRDVVQSVWRAT
ncbi:MAG: DUF5615 family PIN-like protein [Pyrinomonadaceae bacterium]